MSRLFDTVVTHPNPHLDEISAIWLLIKFGLQKYFGGKAFAIEFWGTGGQTIDGRTTEQHEEEGKLLVGIGGGRFDEHPVNGSDRKGKATAATLVAKDLGVIEEPALRQILRFVQDEDLKGSNAYFDLANLIKSFPATTDPVKVLRFAFQALEAKYAQQVEFYANAENPSLKIETIKFGEKVLKLGVIESDNQQSVSYTRYKGATLVIQRNSKGQVQILGGDLNVTALVCALRVCERKERGETEFVSWNELEKEGKIENWYYQKSGGMILNGSLSAPDVPPTQIPLARVIEIVKLVFSGSFKPEKATGCENGRCSSTQANPCDWYELGLERCRQIRAQRYTKNQQK